MNKKALTFDEMLEYTGFSRSYAYKLTMAGKIPGASKPLGKLLFFDREKLEKWLLGSPIMTEDEKETKASTYVTTH